MIFEGSQAQLTGAEYQEQPRDANAERQRDNNLSTTAHTVGAFPYSGKCHNEKFSTLPSRRYPQFAA